jgi:hypothetical protein
MRNLAAAAALLLFGVISAALAQSTAPPEPAIGVHIGVATCNGSNCHNATQRPRNSAVPGNEFAIWSKRDKHKDAYNVLLQEPAIRMAKALGLPDAAHQKRCLDCHADNVSADMRGPLFHLEDGVGCESCHGGASRWLGVHISGGTHGDNIRAGLYPTDKPVERAEKCLSCHYGDGNRYVDHQLYGAGHPRLAFELDTYTAIEPAHFVADKGYVERKGRITDLQVWAAGQVIALARRMEAVMHPRQAHTGIWPDFAYFDCQSCHHDYDPLHGPRPSQTGLGPGTVKFNDANAVMLRVAATRVAPAAAKSLYDHMLALHQATQDDWAAVQREAAAVHEAALSLETALAQHDFTPDDMRALADALITLGSTGTDWQFSHAEQVAMALQAIVAGLKSSGAVGDQQGQAMTNALNAVNAAFPSEGVLRPDAFAKALKDLQRTMRR